ncbi:NAD(P)H-dependent oxidoreductase [Streptomyces sp. NPDC023723]|uniref:NADPH-dependent FMN reductase n=1 Tax=Streptomyces sp. NPDC023723 TaxID=3154323 RepID=UPI0033EFF6E7
MSWRSSHAPTAVAASTPTTSTRCSPKRWRRTGSCRTCRDPATASVTAPAVARAGGWPSPRSDPDREHRPNRAGEPTARWVAEQAAADGVFDIEVVDLAEIDLPMLAEPGHPSARDYQMPSTRAFSEVIDRASAYIFVMPEYNHSYNAALKNALDHLFWEWHGKPVILVSYGGVAAGARAAMALEPVLISLQPQGWSASSRSLSSTSSYTSTTASGCSAPPNRSCRASPKS